MRGTLRHSSLGKWARWALVLAVVGAIGVVVPASATEAGTDSVAVSGTLISVVDENTGQIHYALDRDDGATIPLSVSFERAIKTPARWSGRIAVPERVSSRLGAHPDGGAVVDELVRIGRPARVVSTGTAVPTEVAPGPTAHHWYVAVLTGLGTTITDSGAEDLVDDVASYWKGQANGKISAVTVEPTPLRYTSSTATAHDCGLATSEQWGAMRDEAEERFPAADFYSGDQIMVIVPNATCDGGSAVGMGELGTSFASGGFTVVRDDPTFGLSTAAHEVGHNYGFQHAGLYACGQASVGCLAEYGGVYDVMGYAVDETALPALNTPYRVMAGITDTGEVAETDFTAPFTTSWTIRPRSSATGQRSVHLIDPDTGDDIWVDYRDGSGADTGTAYANGTTLGYGLEGYPDYTYNPGVVLERRLSGDRTAVTPATIGMAALHRGDSWSNTSGSLQVTFDSIESGTAAITVTYAPTGIDPGPGSVILTGNTVFGDNPYLDAETTGWREDATLSYTWLRDEVEIPDAGHFSQYRPTADDVDHEISVRVTGAFADGGWIHSVTSDPRTIQPATISIYTWPSLSGEPRVGAQLHATPGSWIAPFAEVSSTWQWQADSTPIPDANDATLTLTAAQVGKTVCACQILSAVGYAPMTVCSEQLGPVTDGVVVGPISPAPTPRLSGTARVGTALTVTLGIWDPDATVTWQWLVGGVPVDRGTRSRFIPLPTDVGRRVTFLVTATKGAAEVTRSVTSAAVAKGRLVSSVPRIRGTAKVGRLLKVVVGTWTGGTRLTYAWFANGKRVAKAHGTSLKLRRAMKGKRITVRVTGAKPGYATLTRTSKKTARVHR